MVRCSIFYDNEKKEQFFMVRGDERYARSTKTVLEYVSVSEDTLDYDCTLSVNVLRDVGEGSIVLYDNDVLTPVLVYDEDTSSYVEMDSLPWSSLNNGLQFKVSGLTYDVDHNFSAKYIGNKSCSPSNSNVVTVNRHDTNRTEAVLTISSGSQYNPSTIITKDITLSNDLVSSYNAGQDIVVKYDNVIIDTVTTESDGTASVDIPSGTAGLHTIVFDYGGSSHLSAKTVTQQVSVGYNIEIVSCPSVIIGNENTSCSVKFADWFDNPVSGTTIYCDSNHSIFTTVGSGTTGTNGIATFNINIPVSSSKEVTLTFGTAAQVYSCTQNAYVIYPTSVTASLSPTPLTKGNTSVLTVQAEPRVENTPIQITGAVTQTLYTNSNGVATYNATGNGTSSKTYNVAFGSRSASVASEDYLQYWSPNNSINAVEGVNFNIEQGSMVTLQSYFRFTPRTSSPYQMSDMLSQTIRGYAVELEFLESTYVGDYELKLYGLTTSQNTIILAQEEEEFPTISSSSQKKYNGSTVTITTSQSQWTISDNSGYSYTSPRWVWTGSTPIIYFMSPDSSNTITVEKITLRRLD